MEMTMIINETNFTEDLTEPNKDKKTSVLQTSFLYVDVHIIYLCTYACVLCTYRKNTYLEKVSTYHFFTIPFFTILFALLHSQIHNILQLMKERMIYLIKFKRRKRLKLSFIN